MINNAYEKTLRELRRRIHAYPELAYKEFKTQGIIIGELERMGVSYRKIGTGVVANIYSGKEKTIAFRADMDALPITEINDVPYKSKVEGVMHACGHDGHTALLLTFIEYCVNNPDKMTSNAVFIFQPAEETEGGAVKMIECGALDGVDEIYAVHVEPSLHSGVAGLKKGDFMAGAYEFDIVFDGKSSHCAQKSNGNDALHALMHMIEELYSGIERLNIKGLFHCGKLCGGYARNIVADRAEANCTIRYFSEGELNKVLSLINIKLKEAEMSFGVKGKTKLLTNYIPLANDGACVDKVKKYINSIELPIRFISEDFAFYLKKKKGCIIWLGVGDGETLKGLHTPDFDFDEGALLYGLKLYISLIEEKING